MARVRLYLWQAEQPHEYLFFRPDGSLGAIEGLRLRAFVRFLGRVDTRTDEGKTAAFPRCVVDTGAHLSVVPEKTWRYFLPGVVTPLPFHPSMPSWNRRLTIAGGTFPYDLGELVIPLVDQHGGVDGRDRSGEAHARRRAAPDPAHARVAWRVSRRPVASRRTGHGRPTRPAVGA